MRPDPDFLVLVVDDDADTRSNLCDILELDHYHVETAGTVAEVLKRNDWTGHLGHPSGSPAARRQRRGTAAAPAPTGSRGRDPDRDRLRGSARGHRRSATGSGRLHPQADQRRRPPGQPEPNRRAAATDVGQGAQRDRLPHPRRGRPVPDRHPPGRSHHRLLQPLRRGTDRLPGRRSAGRELCGAVSCAATGSRWSANTCSAC